MDMMKAVLFIVIALLLLGCASQTPTLDQQLEAARQQSTRSALQLDSVAGQVNSTTAAQTAVAQQATAQANLATLEVLTAQETAVASTAVAQNSAMADLSISQAQIHMNATRSALEVTVVYDQWQLGQLQTAEALHFENTIARQTREAERLQIETSRELERLARERMWRRMTPWLVGFALAVLFGWMRMLWIRRIQHEAPIQHVQVGPMMLPVLATGNGGFKVWTNQRAEQLLLGEVDDIPLLPAVGDRVPKWERFATYKHPLKLPVGVDVVSGKPVFIDRSKTPHIAIGGRTGMGKTRRFGYAWAANMVTAGLGVVVINAGGSDFQAFKGHPNIRVIPRPEGDPLQMALERAEYLNQFLTAVLHERNRRDGVLVQWRCSEWFRLPAQAGESGEIQIFVDEFIEAVKDLDALTLANRSDKALKARSEKLIGELWHRLIVLTSTGRKYGIFLTVALTAVTGNKIGKQLATIVDQMGAVAFKMNSAPATRSFLNLDSGEEFSHTLPTGEFLTTINGQVQHVRGFAPNDGEIGRYMQTRDVPPVKWPELIRPYLEQADNSPTPLPNGHVIEGQTTQTFAPSAPQINIDASPSKAELDALTLEPVLCSKWENGSYKFGSFNTIGEFFYDRTPSGQEIDETVKPALRFLLERGKSERVRQRARVLLSRERK